MSVEDNLGLVAVILWMLGGLICFLVIERNCKGGQPGWYFDTIDWRWRHEDEWKCGGDAPDEGCGWDCEEGER